MKACSRSDRVFFDQYKKIAVLGEGAYGVVYKAEDIISHEIVAIKKVKADNEEGLPSTAVREISLLKELSHPNIIMLKDVVIDDRAKIAMIFEYADCDLKKFMDRHKQSVPQEIVKNFLYQLLLGLYYCHSHRIIHRDLKPQNVLITKDGVLKLGDFGLARTFGLPMGMLTHEVVTLWYRAPEILLGQNVYSLTVDIWSVGCIFAEMVENKILFKGDSEIGQIFSIFSVLGTPDESTWPGVSQLMDYKTTFPKWKPQLLHKLVPHLDSLGMNLLEKMIVADPRKRITAKAALMHPYFEGVDISKAVTINSNE